MVVGNQGLQSTEELAPLHLCEGLPVTLQNRDGFFKGLIHLLGVDADAFEIAPRIDINNHPMGEAITIPWTEMSGDGATVRVFPR